MCLTRPLRRPGASCGSGWRSVSRCARRRRSPDAEGRRATARAPAQLDAPRRPRRPRAPRPATTQSRAGVPDEPLGSAGAPCGRPSRPSSPRATPRTPAAGTSTAALPEASPTAAGRDASRRRRRAAPPLARLVQRGIHGDDGDGRRRAQRRPVRRRASHGHPRRTIRASRSTACAPTSRSARDRYAIWRFSDAYRRKAPGRLRCDAGPTRSSRATPTRASSASRSSRTGSRSARSSPGRCRESAPWPRSRSPSRPTARGCSSGCAAGEAPSEALGELLAADEQARFRQVAVVDAPGRVAVHTGDGCIPDAGHVEGDGFSVQANMMASAGVWPAMAEAFGAADGPLARRLLAALEAAEAAGGDVRGRQSAALLVVPADRRGLAEGGRPAGRGRSRAARRAQRGCST